MCQTNAFLGKREVAGRCDLDKTGRLRDRLLHRGWLPGLLLSEPFTIKGQRVLQTTGDSSPGKEGEAKEE